MGGMLVGLLSVWIIVTIAINVLVFSSNTQSWGTVDSFRESLQTGLDLSRPADVTTTTLPMIVASIRPWLPGGLPALFQL
jgi:hypothetical protein